MCKQRWAYRGHRTAQTHTIFARCENCEWENGIIAKRIACIHTFETTIDLRLSEHCVRVRDWVYVPVCECECETVEGKKKLANRKRFTINTYSHYDEVATCTSDLEVGASTVLHLYTFEHVSILLVFAYGRETRHRHPCVQKWNISLMQNHSGSLVCACVYIHYKSVPHTNDWTTEHNSTMQRIKLNWKLKEKDETMSRDHCLRYE